jgi:hypothetical protein
MTLSVVLVSSIMYLTDLYVCSFHFIAECDASKIYFIIVHSVACASVYLLVLVFICFFLLFCFICWLRHIYVYCDDKLVQQ